MALVAGRSRVNRPYFFREAGGSRMEIPSFSTGQGDLDVIEEAKFREMVAARQIDEVAPAPVNTVAPAVTGTPEVGSELECSTGTWQAADSYAYQWQSSPDGEDDWADIASATTNAYEPVVGDVGDYIRCIVTATGAGGAASAASNVVGPVTSGD